MANPTKVCGVVRSIQGHGGGVYAVDFEIPQRASRYLPGQFLHLTLEEFDPTSGYWPESRVFSIASEPGQDVVTVVYSVKGSYTKRMEAELHVGRSVWLKLPFGAFIISDHARVDGPVVLVAGGTGVSPYWPFLKRVQGGGHQVHLFYGVREPGHVLFRDDLVRLVANPWIKVHLFVESGAEEQLRYHSGRLSVDAITETLGKDATGASYYLSGPPGMIRAFRSELMAKETPETRIHIDEWE